MKHRHDVDVGAIFRAKERFHEREASLPFNRKIAIALSLWKFGDQLRVARAEGAPSVKPGGKTA